MGIIRKTTAEQGGLAKALLAALTLYQCTGQTTRPVISLAGQPGVSIRNFDTDSLGNLYLSGNTTDLASANPVFPNLLVSGDGDGLTWRTVETSYRSLEILTASRTDPGVVWASAIRLNGQAELVQSRNGGRSWRIAHEGTHSAVAVNPSDPRVILTHAGFVYRSTDGGDTWIRTSNGTTSPRLAFDPFGSGAAVSWGGLDSRISYDAGNSWRDLLEAPPTAPIPIDAFAFDQFKSGTAYRSARTSGGNGPATIFRSRDLRTWVPVARWNDSRAYPRSLYADPVQPRRIWAAATNSVNGDLVIGGRSGGIYRSDDEGETWLQVSALPAQSITSCGGVFLAKGAILLRSTGGAAGWSPVPQAVTTRGVAFGAGCVAYAANVTFAGRPTPPYVAKYSPAGDRIGYFPGVSFDAVSEDGDFAVQWADLVRYDAAGKERFRVPRTEDEAFLLFGPDKSLHAVSRTRIYKWDDGGNLIYARSLPPGLASNSASFPVAVVDRSGRLILAPAAKQGSDTRAIVVFDETGENPTAISGLDTIPASSITALAMAADGDLVAAGLTSAAVPAGTCIAAGGAWFGRFRAGTFEPLWQRTLAASNSSVTQLRVGSGEGEILAGFTGKNTVDSPAPIWVENSRPFGERLSAPVSWAKLSREGDLLWSTPIPDAIGYSVRSVRDGRLLGIGPNGAEVLEILSEDRRQDAGVDNVANALSGARPVPARAGAVTILTLTGRNFGPDEFLDLGLNEENPPFELNGIRVEAGGEGKPLRLLAAGPTSITAILDLSSGATPNPSESSLRLRVLSERNGAMDPVSIATTLPNEPYTDGVLRESSPCSNGPQIVFNEDGSRDSEQSPARVGTAVTVLATGLDQRIFARAVGFAPGVYTITARIPAGAPGGLSDFPSTAAGMKIEAWVAR